MMECAKQSKFSFRHRRYENKTYDRIQEQIVSISIRINLFLRVIIFQYAKMGLKIMRLKINCI
jgi:hypothetical protein